MGIIYHDVDQGTDEWLQLRRGLMTASEIKLIMTPTLKIANNEKERAHLFELLAQRITGYTEPHYFNDDMLRGHEDEIEAKIAYAENYAPVTDIGFITNDQFGFTMGFSPDGLVGDEGLIECKSRRAKFQIETILSGEMPLDYMLQVQSGLLISGRLWCDFISYSAGLPMMTVRVFPDDKVQNAIIEAAYEFENRLQSKWEDYKRILESPLRLIPTERRIEQEITA